MSQTDNVAPSGRMLNENQGPVLKHGGPYIGTIMQTDDQTYMGRLRVWIPEISSTDPQNQQSWVTVHYAPPFYGSTNITDPDGAADVTNTPQSYGMWFVPPDIGVQVLVMFANLDPSKGYWIGCVPKQLQNHMIPGIAHRGSTSDNAETLDPVTEYNKHKLHESKNPFTPDSAYARKNITPPHLVQKTVLEAQGLNKDEARGLSTSTVRRETPSNVYGISTPGPITKRKNASVSSGQDYRTVYGRKGGHQFVLDDGDLDGNNQLIRIRSTNGGQVLIHDSIGSIYIINQTGNAWIELTNSGRIDVYSKNSTSIHSEADINMTADNNVNILASKSFNLVSPTINIEGTDINVWGKASIRQKTPNYVISADSFSVNTAGGAGGGKTGSPGTGIRMSSDKDIEMVATGNLFLQTAANFEQVATGKIVLSANGNLALNSKAQLQLNGAAGIYEEALPGAGTITQFTKDVDKDFTSGDTRGDTHPPTSWTGKKNWHEGAADKPSHSLQAERDSGVVEIPKPFSSGKDVSHVPITPQHEPWAGHEVQYRGGGGGATASASASPSSAAGTGGSTAAGASAGSAGAAGGAAPASGSLTGSSGAAASIGGAAGAVSGAQAAANAAGQAAGSAAGAVSNAASAVGKPNLSNLAPTALAAGAAGATAVAASLKSSGSNGQAAGAPQTGSNSAPAAATGSAPSAVPSPAESSAPIATVNEPGLPEGAPTTGIGMGYNIQSITTVTAVEGSVDYQLSETLAGMLKEMGINWKAYSAAIAARVSNGRYTVVNEKGFMGRYQLSAKALQKAGITFSAPFTKAGVEDPGIWNYPTNEIVSISTGNSSLSVPGTPQMAPGSLEAFLLDRSLQEKLFIDATYMQYSLLKKYKAVTDATSPDEVAGYLAVAWMAGFGVPKGLTSLSPNQTLSAAEVQANTQGNMGNGLVGLIAWWKIAGNNPLSTPGTDPLGKNTYSYYQIGSRSQ